MNGMQDSGDARTKNVTKKAAGITVMCALTIALVGCSPEPAVSKPSAPRASSAPASEPSAPPQVKVDKDLEQNAALDAFVEAERGAIPAVQEANPGVYSEFTVNAVYPSTVEYSYVYAQQVDAAAAQEYFDGMTATFQSLCDSTVFPAMESAGVASPQKVIYTYDNADGSRLWSHTFESS